MQHTTDISLMPATNISQRYFLYADDDADDQQLLRELIVGMNPSLTVIGCAQGLELLQFLEALRAGDALPDCIILDLNMPLWDGLRTLAELKKHSVWQHLPVVVFSTSSAKRDRERALALGAELFLTKPVSQKDFVGIERQLARFCQYA